MAGITSLGAGSGLDAEGIVTKLMAVERIPLTRLNAQTSSYNAKLSAYGTISSNLSSLQTAAQNFYSTQTSLFTASLSDPTVATATFNSNTSNAATPGTYTLETTQLAKAHSLTSSVFGASDQIGTGSLAIADGSNSFSVTIDSSNNTLAGIRDAINNNSSNTSVRASVITDSNGSRLILSSNTTGAANTISVAVTDTGDGNNTDTNGLSRLAYTGGTQNLTQTQAAQNALVKVNNTPLSFSSNTLTDVIPGITLNLSKENTGSPATITVARDSAGLKSLADSFVKAYNDLHSTIAKNTAYDPTSKTASTLTGDATARSIERQLRAALRTVPTGVTGSITQLADVGISIDASGVMSVDATKFQTAIDNNASGLQSMLNGYGHAVNSLVTSLTDTNGLIDARTTGLKGSIKMVGNQVDALNTRLVSIEARYRKQFSSLDTLISGMQSTSSFLTQQIAKM